MPNYRYFTTDVLTGEIIADLPLYQVAPDRILSGAGNLTAKLKLGRGRIEDMNSKNATTPSRTALYMERDDTLIWGGIIWSRKYNSVDKSFDITAQTWESCFDHVAIEEDVIYQNIDQQLTFAALVEQMQEHPISDFNIDYSQVPLDGDVLRTTLFPGYEFHMYSEAINQLVTADNGFDYTIDVVPSGTPDMPLKTIRTGYPKLGLNSEPASFDYPGNIASYTWNESGSSGGTKFAGLGEGSGSAQHRGVANAQDLLDAGYPGWWIVKTNQFLTTDQETTAYASSIRDQYRIPIGSPTFDVKSDRIPEFTDWGSLGNRVNVFIQDERFPDGQLITSRYIGWNLQVASADQPEVLSFNIESVDDA